MTHLIDKSALVAEVEKRRNKHFNSGGSPSSEYCHEDDEILDIIDTLEVKEVDLNKELSYEDYMSFFEKYPDLSDDWGFEEAWTFAQHFFELGLKAAQERRIKL